MTGLFGTCQTMSLSLNLIMCGLEFVKVPLLPAQVNLGSVIV